MYCDVRCLRSDQRPQTEPALSADEPTPLKAVSVGAASGDGVISGSSNGAVIDHESSNQVLVTDHNGAANATNASFDIPMASL